LSVASSVRAWLDAEIGRLSERWPLSDHLDRIGVLPPGADVVDASLAAFAALCTRVAELGDPGRAGLMFPLRTGTRRLTAAVPRTLAALRQQLRPEEPPSIAVVHWGALALLDRQEEYETPLPFDLPSIDGSIPRDRTLYAYYRYVDAYPPGYA
jgi:hypothetical protein